jgi:hypothetical protein
MTALQIAIITLLAFDKISPLSILKTIVSGITYAKNEIAEIARNIPPKKLIGDAYFSISIASKYSLIILTV